MKGKDLKSKYTKLIKEAPDTIQQGKTDIIFVNLYKYVWGKKDRSELIKKFQELDISGLAIAYLLEEVERKRDQLRKYRLSKKYGI